MSRFFAYLDRMRLIRRWGLMLNTSYENDMEHSMQTAYIAHGLAAMGNARYARGVDPLRVLALAMYHDAGEVITGDLPTPVKYMNPALCEAYHGIEQAAKTRLLDMLPDDMRPSFAPYIVPDESALEWRIVKAADRISAYLKCVAEQKMGNTDFAEAKQTITDSILKNDLPEVAEFMSEFVPSFSLSADELSKPM